METLSVKKEFKPDPSGGKVALTLFGLKRTTSGTP
jgi:hypothetical protein